MGISEKLRVREGPLSHGPERACDGLDWVAAGFVRTCAAHPAAVTARDQSNLNIGRGVYSHVYATSGSRSPACRQIHFHRGASGTTNPVQIEVDHVPASGVPSDVQTLTVVADSSH
jgi:hypothetical protein